MDLDLDAALDALQPSNRKCKVGRILDEIPDDDPRKQKLVDRVNDTKTYPSRGLARAFNAMGRPVDPETMRIHRLRDCGCYR